MRKNRWTLLVTLFLVALPVTPAEEAESSPHPEAVPGQLDGRLPGAAEPTAFR
jgi:hypothetical protein